MTPNEIVNMTKEFHTLKKEFEQNRSDTTKSKLCEAKMQQIKLTLNKLHGNACGIMDYNELKKQLDEVKLLLEKLKKGG